MPCSISRRKIWYDPTGAVALTKRMVYWFLVFRMNAGVPDPKPPDVIWVSVAGQPVGMAIIQETETIPANVVA